MATVITPGADGVFDVSTDGTDPNGEITVDPSALKTEGNTLLKTGDPKGAAFWAPPSALSGVFWRSWEILGDPLGADLGEGFGLDWGWIWG